MVQTLNQANSAVLIEGVSKTYASGQIALRDVTLSIEEGEFFGLLGPNGAGKSTLINCMAGLVEMSEGRIFIMGHDVSREKRQAALNLGMVPQEITCDPFLTVRETLNYQSGYWGIRHNDAWIDEIPSALGLADKGEKLVRQLSGGMKRRVLVAQALVHRPRVIVLDEPTAGVDVELRDNLWRFIGELHRAGHTILLTTHYLEEAQAMCSRVAIMKDGRPITVDHTDRLLASHAERRLTCRLERGELPEGLLSLLAHRQGPELTSNAADAKTVREILGALEAAQCTIPGLTIREANLEDVFLRLTGGAA